MRIAVIGTGNVGSALGRRWRGAGHDVVVLAVPGPAVAEVIAPHGAALDGRVVIDAANNIGGAQVNSHAAVAAAAPGAGDASAVGAVGAVDSLLPLWFALMQQHGGNRRIALRITQ